MADSQNVEEVKPAPIAWIDETGCVWVSINHSMAFAHSATSADPPGSWTELVRVGMSREHIVARVLAGVCDLEGYTSPDDNPELLQCTVSELETVVRRALGEDV